jgi:hypothetical protein
MKVIIFLLMFMVPTFAICGNGICEADETPTSCSYDCKVWTPICGNGVCEAGETLEQCPRDCSLHVSPNVCDKDGLCEKNETVENCPSDCSLNPPARDVCSEDLHVKTVALLEEGDGRIDPTDTVMLVIYLEASSDVSDVIGRIETNILGLTSTSGPYTYQKIDIGKWSAGYFKIKTRDLTPGKYLLNLLVTYKKDSIECSDALEFQISVRGGYGVSVNVDPDRLSVRSGDKAVFMLNIKNVGEADDTYSIRYDGPDLFIPHFEKTIDVKAGQAKNLQINIDIPALSGTYKCKFTVTSQRLASISASDVVYLDVLGGPKPVHAINLMLEKHVLELQPGDSKSLWVSVQNTGTVSDVVGLSLVGPDWVYITPKTISLLPGEIKNIELYLAPPETTGFGKNEIKIFAKTYDGDASAKEEVVVYIGLTPEKPTSEPPVAGPAGFVMMARESTLPIIALLEAFAIILLSLAYLKSSQKPEVIK